MPNRVVHFEIEAENSDILTVGTYAKCQDTEGNNFSLLQAAPEMVAAK